MAVVVTTLAAFVALVTVTVTIIGLSMMGALVVFPAVVALVAFCVSFRLALVLRLPVGAGVLTDNGVDSSSLR